jgi:DNA-directed RNA polymerase sigma subunit (sigma70/sigma32)
MKKEIETVFFSDYHNQFENFEIETQTLEARILRAFATLTQREVEVLTRHFGLFGYNPETYKEIALTIPNAVNWKMGISIEAARVIEEKALRKLRHPARRHFFE